MRILIAEDDTLSRMILESAIEQLGHECLSADNGRQAWDLLESTQVDVLISDRMMPGMDGIDLCRRVRARAGADYTYFIFLTALDNHDDLLAGIEVGADDYLAKPLNLDDLQVRLLVAARLTALHRRLAEQQAELERLNQRLFDQARQDGLTGLGNRLRLREDLNALAGRDGHRGYCALLCDVDYFKQYNDHYGHLAGDEALRTIARTIAEKCRGDDVAYRYGGEEFLLILAEQPPATATAVAERLRRAVESLALPHAARTPPHILTISVGIAMLEPESTRPLHDWLRDADAALYRAKQAGRNRVAG